MKARIKTVRKDIISGKPLFEYLRYLDPFAEIPELSVATVKREWAVAKVLLKRELSGNKA